jgi:hypothetical protein
MVIDGDTPSSCACSKELPAMSVCALCGASGEAMQRIQVHHTYDFTCTKGHTARYVRVLGVVTAC